MGMRRHNDSQRKWPVGGDAAPDHSFNNFALRALFGLISAGNAVIVGRCSQPAPHICIVASQLRRVRVTYNKLTLMAYPPPGLARDFSNREKQLTAPADRPVRESAHAVAFTTVVAIRGAGSVHRRTGMQTARALAADSGRPGSQDPRIPACYWLPAKPTPGVAGQSHSLLGRLHQSTPTGFAGSKQQMGHVHHRHRACRRACMPFGAARVKGGPG